jgi:hypothetical protein
VSARLAIAAAAAALTLPLLTGCYSFSNYGRARVVDEGHVEAWAAPEALVVTSGSGASIRPIADLGVRYGLTHSVELDARLTSVGVSAGPKLSLLRAPSRAHGVDVALAPALGFTYPDKVAAELPLLVGINLHHRDQLVLAPRIAYLERFGVPGFSRPVSFAFAGGSLGYVWQVTRSFALMPEVSALAQLYAEPGWSSNVGGGLGLQGGIGFLYDL